MHKSGSDILEESIRDFDEEEKWYEEKVIYSTDALTEKSCSSKITARNSAI